MCYMNKNHNSSCGARLKLLIQDSKKSQNTVAAELGTPKGTLSRYVRDVSTPPLTEAVRIAEYFQVSLDYLAGISDCRSHDTDMQAVCRYTGLSDAAIRTLQSFQTLLDCNAYTILDKHTDSADFLSIVFESAAFQDFLFHLYYSAKVVATPEGKYLKDSNLLDPVYAGRPFNNEDWIILQTHKLQKSLAQLIDQLADNIVVKDNVNKMDVLAEYKKKSSEQEGE